MDHGWEVFELVGCLEEGFRAFSGCPADAEECGAELPPVLLSEDVCLLEGEFCSVCATVVGYPLVHVDADLGKDVSGCVVECVVEVEDPEHVVYQVFQ